MFREHRIAVVVPAYNEERLLPGVLNGIPAWVDEAIVVDDASEDATGRVARAVQDRRVRILTHSHNMGVGAAIRTGYREAVARGARVVAVMAGDAQMVPDELEHLVAPIVERRVDYAVGDRVSHPAVLETMPRVRRLGVRVLAGATRWVTGYRQIRDAQCGFTAISAEAIRSLPLDRLYARYGYPNDLLCRLAEAGLRVGHVTVTPVYGDEVSGLRPWRALFTHSWILARGAWRRFLNKPVRVMAKGRQRVDL